MAHDKIDRLYDVLKADGAITKDKENFRNYMLASGHKGYENRKRLYEALKEDGADVGENYEEFAGWLGLQPKVSAGAKGSSGTSLSPNMQARTDKAGIASTGNVSPAPTSATGVQAKQASPAVNGSHVRQGVVAMQGGKQAVPSSQKSAELESAKNAILDSFPKPAGAVAGKEIFNVAKPLNVKKGREDKLYKVRKGGKDFEVTDAEIVAAGGFEGYSRKHGGGLRVYMKDRNGKRIHVDASAVNKKIREGFTGESRLGLKNFTPSPFPKRGFSTPQARMQGMRDIEEITGGFETFSKEVRENSARLAESHTPQGRERIKAATTLAKARGLNTDLSGVFTKLPGGGGVSVTSDAQENASGTNLPIHAPQVYGIKRVDGKDKIEWLMPDGSLTTDRMEAENSATFARKGRLQHEFLGRMKENGLDPANKSDLLKQKVLDALSVNEKEQKSKDETYRELNRKELSWDSNKSFLENVVALSHQSLLRGDREAALTGARLKEHEDEDAQNLKAEHYALTRTLTRIEAAKNLTQSDGAMNGTLNFRNNAKNAWQGTKDVLSDEDLWLGGLLSAHQATRLLEVERKLKSGGQPTESELSLMASMVMGLDAEELSKLPHGYKMMQTTVEMFPFMVQMITNPASGLSKALVKRYGKGLIKKFGKEAVKKNARKYVAGKVAATVAGDIAESAILANTLQLPRTHADIINRYLGEATETTDGYSFRKGISWGEAIRKGQGAAVIENYTEMLGEHFGAIGRAISASVGKGVAKLAGNGKVSRVVESVSTLIDKVGSTDFAKAVSALEKKAKWNGITGEVLEEEAGIVLNSILVGDNKLSDLIDPEQQIDIVLGVGLFGGFVSGIKTIGYPIALRRAKKKHSRQDRAGSWRFGDEWEGIRDLMDMASDNEVSQVVCDIINKNCKTAEQAETIRRYAESLMRLRGHNLAKAKVRGDAENGGVSEEQVIRIEREDEAESHYEEGYQAGSSASDETDAQNADAREIVDAISQRYREALEGIEVVFGPEAEARMAEMQENPWGLLTNPELAFDQQDAVLKLINAKYALDGVQDAQEESAERKREAVTKAVEKRTHKDAGVVIPATMKVDDRQVYIVKGNVAMFEDGTGVDVHNSDQSVVILDPQKGEIEFTSPDQIFKVGEAVDPQTELAGALAEVEAGRNVFPTEVTEPDTASENIPTDGNNEGENIPVVNVEEYDKGYGDAIEEAQNLSDERLDHYVDVLREGAQKQMQENGRVDDYIRGRLEALEFVQQNRAGAAVPKTEENVPNPTENAVLDTENVSEAVSTVENGQQTALQRLPKDAEGEPIFEQAENAEHGWDAAVEYYDGDAAAAKEMVDLMTSEKRKELEKAQKAKVKGKTPKEIKESQRANAATLARVHSEFEMWDKMSRVEENRQAAIRSQQEAEARRIAAERAEAEKAERAAQEEAARIEREALEGIPEWHMDTPENARARGSRRFSGQLFMRQEPVQGVPGKEVEVKFSQNDLPKGRVAVIEASQLQPSHLQGQRNPMFFIDEAQPKNRAEAVSTFAAKQIAEGIRPEEITGGTTAYTGAPSVNTRGEVIQGNNRSDALRYMWDNALPDQQAAYKQYLIDNADQFGIDPEAVKDMQQPVLVNMLDVDDAEAIRLGQKTAQDTESGGIERIKPKNVAQTLGEDMRTFANMLLRSSDEEATFGQLVDRNGTDVLKWMSQVGAITDTQYQSAFDSKGNMTAEAKNDLQKVLYQAIFKGGSQQLEEMFDRLPAKAQRALLSTAFRDMDSPLARKMLPEIQASITAYDILMGDQTFREAKNMEGVLRAVESFKATIALDDRFEQYMPADNFSNFALHLAAMYKASDMSQTTIASYFNQMYDLAQGKKEATLFEDADTTEYPLADIIKKVLNIDYKPAKNGNNNVANGGADVALRNQVGQGGELRGNKPPASREQTPAGTEPSDRGTGVADDSTAAGRNTDVPGGNTDDASNGELAKGITPSVGPFGEIYTQFKGKPQEAVTFLLAKRSGEAIGALHHRDIGEIDLVWGKEGTAHSDGYGLAKLAKFHPEVLFNLQEILNGMVVTKRSTNRVQLESDKYQAAVRLTWDDKKKTWLLTMFEKKNSVPDNTTDTVETLSSNGNDTATPENTVNSSDVRSVPAVGEGINTDTSEVNSGQTEGATAPAGNSSQTSDSKDNQSLSEEQISGEESSLQPSDDKGVELEQPSVQPSVQASVQAASVEVNTEPTPAQAEAGNYKKGHVTIGEFDITIENPEGSIRKGVDADGKEWQTTMANTYGYIKGTESADGDPIDVFLHENMNQWDGHKVYVVDQTKPDGSFDEHKVMLGFNDKDDAMSAYLANYDATWAEKHPGLRISEVYTEDFNKWIQSSKRKTKPFAEYSAIRHTCPVCGKHGIQDYESDGGVCPQCGSDLDVFRMIASLSDEEAKEVAEDLGLIDNQGNPIDENGNLIVEKVESVDAITDKDFIEPYRTVRLPPLPENVANAVGLQGVGPIIKKNVFDKNKKHHKDLTPEDGRIILNHTLYNPQLYGQNQKTQRPYNWILVHLADKNSAVVVEVNNPDKDNAEIVNWHYIGGSELERKKRQAVKEGGLILTLSEDNAAADTHDDLLSDGKVNTLSSDKQESNAESSKGYAITPATYTNKKGKETPMHRLEFGRELTKEEESAVKKFASEKQGKGRFAPARGWKDRENGGWLFRTEEDARKAGDLIGNDEAVADAQPLSREDIISEVRGQSDGVKDKPKKTPINCVSVEDLQKEVRGQSDEVKDYADRLISWDEPGSKENPFLNVGAETQDVQITDEMEDIAKQMRDILGVDDSEIGGVHFRDPDELKPEQKRKLVMLGIVLTMRLFDQGKTDFPTVAKVMVGMVGEKIKPWIKAMYKNATIVPGYEDMQFTSDAEIDRFDIANFDKPNADVMKQAEMIVAERKAKEATSQAEKEVIETRNQKRKEHDKQTEAGTAALGEKAEAVASKAESVAETSANRDELNRAAGEIDDTLDEVNEQLALLGYYEADLNSPEHEVYGLRRSAEKKAVKDATKLAKQLIDDLGIDLTIATQSSPNKNGKTKKKPLAASNLTGIDGDITINLPMPDGRNLHINIGLTPRHERGVESNQGGGAWEGDNLEVDKIMFRFEDKEHRGDGSNHFLDPTVTYANILADIQRFAKWGMPKAKPADTKGYQHTELEKITQLVSDETYSKIEESIAAGGIPNVGKLKKGIASRKKRMSLLEKGAATAISNDEMFKKHQLAVANLQGEIDGLQRALDYINKRIAETDKQEAPADKPADTSKSEVVKTEDGYDAGGYWDRHEITEPEKNGFKVGEKVWYTRNDGKGKRELATIVDFGGGADVTLDTGMAPVMYEACEWSQIAKREPDIFDEAEEVAKRAKAKRDAKKSEKKSVTSPKKKQSEVKPEQPIGDLFSGLFEEAIENNANEKGRTKDTRRNNSGIEPEREGLSETEPLGAGASLQDSVKNSESKRRRSGIGGGKFGTRPQYDVNKDYSNEEIHEIVSSVATIKDGKVEITGELTEDIKAICRQYKSGGVAKKGRGVLDEYYTDGKIVDAVRMLIGPYFEGKSARVLEPSVGIGNFADAWQGMSVSEVVAFEINETTARIAKILHPEMDVNLRSFETEFIDDSGNRKPLPEKFNLIVGNPPYGSHRGFYKGLGEESKIARYEDYFVKRSLDVLEEGGVLAMVLPSSWIDRHAKYGGYTVEVAYRLPSGAFESTQVGTDIVVLRKDGGVSVSEHTPYFEEHPENICGEVRQRRGRFGKLEKYVDGSVDAAIEIIGRENAKRLADRLGVEQTSDNLNEIQSAIEETGDVEKAVSIVKEAKASRSGNRGSGSLSKFADNKGRYKVELRKGSEVVPTSRQFHHSFAGGEVEAFEDTNYDGTLNNPSQHSRYANYIGGKAVHDFYYAEGDIYSKLEQLEQDKKSIIGTYGEEQYEKQKRLLDSVLPKRKEISEIAISPNTTFVKNLIIHTPDGDATLRDMFIEFCRKLPQQAFGGSSSWEVRGYVENEQIYGHDKNRNQLVRERRKRVANDLFVKFLNEELSEAERSQVVHAFNREYNSVYRPDYSKVPMFSTINKDFKGRPLKLTSVQLAGVGRMTVKGVGVLAHEVGFGKTLSGVLAMHEAMTRGFAKKPLIVVPNDNILKQWVETIGEVLPEATVNTLGNLGANYDLTDFRVNDFDFTIVTYEGLKAMSFSDETYNRLLDRFSYITEDLRKHQSERDAQKAKEKRNELKGKVKRGTKATYGFENFGFDYLTFDEVHNANHIVSKVRLDKSVASDFRSQSQRSSELGIKTWLAAQYIQEMNNGRNVLLLSATPFTNKPLEYYSILSLVANDMLRRKGFFNVDQFFSTFMEADNELEIGANGRPIQKTNVRKFRNNGLFQQLLSEFIDIKGEEDNPDLERPERVNREYRLPQNDLTSQAIAAAQNLLSGNDTVLQGIGHARAAAFSPYATSLLGIRPKDHKEFVENSPKIYATIKMIEQNRKDRPDAGQIIYSGVGVEFFPLIRDYLVKESGFKPEEVRIITGATSNAERVNIQTAFNKGDIKVVIGSPAIKEGINLQENTTDMYILSLPWNFTELRQIEGRAWRQGNKWENIRINYMLTDDSVDVFTLQRLQTKQGLYNEAMKRGAESVDVSDIDTAELKTALITDPAVRAQIVTMQERAKLNQEKTQIEADLAFVMRKYETYNELVKDIDNQKDLIKRYEGYAKKDGGYWVGAVHDAERRQATTEQKIEQEKQRLLEKGINVDEIEHQAEESKKAIESINEQIEHLKDFEQELADKYRQESDNKHRGVALSSYLEERKQENGSGFYSIRPKKGESGTATNGDKTKFRVIDEGEDELLSGYDTDKGVMKRKVEELAKSLNLPVRILTTEEEVGALPTMRKRNSKGFYDESADRRGEEAITIILPNHANVADVVRTVFHEGVWHKGIRLFCKDEAQLHHLLDHLYENSSKEIQDEIDTAADAMYMRTLESKKRTYGNGSLGEAQAIAETARMKREGKFRRDATEEFGARVTEEIKEGDFEKMSEDKLNFFGRIMSFVEKAIEKILRGLKVKMPRRYERRDWKMFSHMFYERLRKGETPEEFKARTGKEWNPIFAEAERIAVRYKEEREAEKKKPTWEETCAALTETGTKKPNGKTIAATDSPSRAKAPGYVPFRSDSAKVQKISDRLKSLAEELPEAGLGKNEIVYELSSALGLGNAESGQSNYVNVNANGIETAIRVSNHSANVSNFGTTSNNVGIVIKTSNNRFRTNEGVDYVEFMYYGDRVEGNTERQRAIVNGLRHYIETGSFGKMPEADRLNTSGRYRDAVEGLEDEVYFRDGNDMVAKRPVLARAMYEKRVASSMFQVREAMQDSMLGLLEVYRAIDKASGNKRYIEDVANYQNAYVAENAMSSRNQAEQTAYEKLVIKPMLEEVVKLAPDERSYEELIKYMMAKHGLERNALMRARAKADAMKAAQKADPMKAAKKADATDFAGLTGLFMTDDVVDAESQATKLVRNYEAAHDTTAMWNKVNAATKATLSKLKEGGLLSKDSHDKIANMYDNYIPLRGWTETTTDEVYGYLTRQDASLRGSVLKTANGRTSIADDPIATIAMMGQQAITQANRNKMKQAFLTYVMKNPSDLVSVNQLWLQKNDVTDEWEPVFASNINEGDDPATVEKKISDFEETMKKLSAANPGKYKSGRQARGIPYKIGSGNLNEHIVLVKRGDYTYVITINGNPRAAQALNGLTNPDVGSGVGAEIFKLGEKLNHIIAPIYTTRNPDFIVGNFFRDAFFGNTMVWIKESPRYAGRLNWNFWCFNPIRMAKFISRHNANKLDMSKPEQRLFHEFIMNGGETGYTNQADIEKQKKQVKKMLKRLRHKFSFGGFMDWIAAKWDILNSSVENSMRFAVYVTSRQEGRSVERSVYDAKEISVNFNKKGAGAKFMGATGQTAVGNAAAFVSGTGRGLFVFWNAVVQASTNFFRNAKRHPYKMTGAMVTMFLAGVVRAILGAFGDDDEETNDKNRYFDLPDYVRRSNILIPAGDQYLAHPLPHEYMAVFGMGEMVGTLLMGKEEMSAGEIALNIASLMSEFSPLPIDRAGWDHALMPSSIKPLYEAAINESWTGMPIYKSNPYNTDMPEWTKAYNSTNHALVNLAERLNAVSKGDKYTKGAIDINPAQVEYILNGYLGGYFKFADRMIKMYETAVGEREFEWRNMPLANRVVKQGDERTANRRITNDYFAYMAEYDKLNKRIRNYKRDTKNNVFDYSEKLAGLTQTPEFRRYWIIKRANRKLNAIERNLEKAKAKTENEIEIENLEKERDALREQIVKKIRRTIPVEETDTAGIGDQYDYYKNMMAQ